MALTKVNNRMIDGSLINVWDFLTDVQINDVKTNGSIDVTSGVQAAIDHAISERHQSLFFPAGRYRLTDTITINEGLKLVGNGSQGSTEQFGTTLIIDHTNTAIHFSGTGRDFSGTGGGMKHFLVLKRAGQVGGKGIFIDGTDENKRHGEMQFEDLLLSASSTGRFTYVFHVDGTAYNTSGAKGVRSINFNKVRLTGGDGTVPYILLDQVVHFTATHFQVEEAAGSSPVVAEVKGNSANVLCANANINGEFKIGASTDPLNGFVFMGRCASFNNTNSNVDGFVAAQIAGTITNNSQALNIVSSDTSFLNKTEFNSSSASDDLIKLNVAASEVGRIGTSGSQITTIKAGVAFGEVHISSLDGSSNEKTVLFQAGQVRPSADASMDLGYSNGSTHYRWETVHSSVLSIQDGVTAPSTLPGNALIYVDTADGDLKIKFGDGTVKTIVTDT